MEARTPAAHWAALTSVGMCTGLLITGLQPSKYLPHPSSLDDDLQNRPIPEVGYPADPEEDPIVWQMPEYSGLFKGNAADIPDEIARRCEAVIYAANDESVHLDDVYNTDGDYEKTVLSAGARTPAGVADCKCEIAETSRLRRDGKQRAAYGTPLRMQGPVIDCQHSMRHTEKDREEVLKARASVNRDLLANPRNAIDFDVSFALKTARQKQVTKHSFKPEDVDLAVDLFTGRLANRVQNANNQYFEVGAHVNNMAKNISAAFRERANMRR